MHAATSLLAQGYGAVCLVNSDSPTLPTAFLEHAAAALARPGDRMVLGGADDGGYYLIGLKAPHARLFRDIAWSTDEVAAQTLARAATAGLDVVALPPWFDVDDAASLARLIEDLSGRRGSIRHLMLRPRRVGGRRSLGTRGSERQAGRDAENPRPLVGLGAKRTKDRGRGCRVPHEPIPYRWCASRPKPTRRGGAFSISPAEPPTTTLLALGTALVSLVVLGLFILTWRGLPLDPIPRSQLFVATQCLGGLIWLGAIALVQRHGSRRALCGSCWLPPP